MMAAQHQGISDSVKWAVCTDSVTIDSIAQTHANPLEKLPSDRRRALHYRSVSGMEVSGSGPYMGGE
jgi:hypothetical protein